MITRERLLEVFDIDIITGIIQWAKPHSKARHIKIGDLAGCIHNKGYWWIRIDGKRFLAHHIIWFIAKGYWPKNQIDHIDGKKLNNAITNLREVTNQQNSWNSYKRKNNVSGYKGVSWHNYSKKWQVSIFVENKKIYIGVFESKNDAARAYNEAAIKYHGEYVKLNIVEEME